jgi:CheY-like chemotaxis protein
VSGPDGAPEVLVAEDDPDLRDVILEVLTMAGYRALGLSNGAEVLAYLRSTQDKPRLILLDIMMPLMDGWQFRKLQLEDPEIAGVPVVVLSAHSQRPGDLETEGHLQKPIEIDALIDVARKFCGERVSEEPAPSDNRT